MRVASTITTFLVSLIMFTPATQADNDWRSIANQRIAELRQGDFVVQLTDAQGKPVTLNGPAEIRQVRSHFHFGTCFAGDALSEDPVEVRYRQFILDHFNTLVSENDMKWNRNQPEPGPMTYDVAERMMQWAAQHNLAVRGHCIVWEKREFNRKWVRELTGDALRQAIEARIDSVVPQFKGRLIAWDVNNEMLDGNFYSQQLGEEIRADIFRRVAKLDPVTPLFLNDYSILGNQVRTQALLDQVNWFRERGCKIDGLGVQEHGCERFARLPAPARQNNDAPAETATTTEEATTTPDGSVTLSAEEREAQRQARMDQSSRNIYATLDQLTVAGVPIHLTEISSRSRNHQIRADGLEVMIRTAFSHPKVDAILVWGFWSKRHWFKDEAALVDDDWNLTPAGKRLQQMLLEEWRTRTQANIDAQGQLRFRGFYGSYEVTLPTSAGPRTIQVNLTPQERRVEVTMR